jgi:hypothetical protein
MKDYLTLKHASGSRPFGKWSDDHFEVLAEGVVVGRIFKSGRPGCGTLAFGFGSHDEVIQLTKGLAALN